jgi:DTW domain-containing protein
MVTKRASCAVCLRPQRACICGCVRSVQSDVEVLILQHPSEVLHAKGTARLLHLCLPNSRIVVGEVFDENALQALLTEGGKQAVLLYPADCEQALFGTALSHIRLVVLDATWQNSRRLLRLNPLLQTLPRMAFKKPEPTRYSAIRIAHAPHQLSTIEATGAMLAQLEKGFDTQPLLAAFDDFIVLQQSYLPTVRRYRNGERIGWLA